jgi:hypothetical protein
MGFVRPLRPDVGDAHPVLPDIDQSGPTGGLWLVAEAFLHGGGHVGFKAFCGGHKRLCAGWNGDQ